MNRANHKRNKAKRHGLLWWLFISWWWLPIKLVFFFPIQILKLLIPKRHNAVTIQEPDPVPMSNNDYSAMRQAQEDLLERQYDLSTVKGINAIPVPKHKESPQGNIGSPVGKIEYYLLHKAGVYEKAGEVELALACYRKANALMPYSYISYGLDSYMRLPRYLRKLRRFDEARAEEAKIDALWGNSTLFIGSDHYYEERNKNLFANMREFRTDLVEASYIRCCCSECAKYRERVYSLSGNDKRFPKLPELLLSDHDCGIMLYPYIEDVNGFRTRDGKELRGRKVIKYSNRPFVDDRTAEELADLRKIEDEKKAEQLREITRAEYDWLWEFMPEICPKSLSAYSRMKNANTVKYQAIVKAAKEKARTIYKQ